VDRSSRKKKAMDDQAIDQPLYVLAALSFAMAAAMAGILWFA